MSGALPGRASLAALGLVGISIFAGCQHRQTIDYPKAVEAGPTEAAFDCPRLDDAILKADAVRWVMRQDGARLLSPEEYGERATGAVLLAVLSGFACFGCLPVYVGDEGHAVVNGADRRLLSLLKLKSDRACPATPTSIPGMDDLQLYAAVSDMVAEEARKSAGTDVGQIREERLRLLDGLRAPPSPGP